MKKVVWVTFHSFQKPIQNDYHFAFSRMKKKVKEDLKRKNNDNVFSVLAVCNIIFQQDE
jgi:hypothetical protein